MFSEKKRLFLKNTSLDVWHGSDYTSGLSCFAGFFSEGYSGLFDICETDYSIHSKLRIFPLFRSHKWKYKIQPDKRLTKV